MVAEKGWEGPAKSRFSVFSNTLSDPKLLNRKSEGSRLSPLRTGNQRSSRSQTVAAFKTETYRVRYENHNIRPHVQADVLEAVD